MNLYLLLNQEDQSLQIQKMIKAARLQEWNQCSSGASTANRTSRPLLSLDLPPHLKMKHQNVQMQRMGKFDEDAIAHCHGVCLLPLQFERGTRTFHQGCRLERGGTSQWREGGGEAHHHRQDAGVLQLPLEGVDLHLH